MKFSKSTGMPKFKNKKHTKSRLKNKYWHVNWINNKKQFTLKWTKPKVLEPKKEEDVN